MSNEKHTPTPWEAEGRAVVGPRPEYEICVCTVDDDDGVINQDMARANAAFIVRACNSHKALVDALEEDYAAILDALDATSGQVHEVLMKAAASNRAALKQAKENA